MSNRGPPSLMWDPGMAAVPWQSPGKKGHGKGHRFDIEPKMIKRVTLRAYGQGVTNLEARTANVYDLPFEDGAFSCKIEAIKEI